MSRIIVITSGKGGVGKTTTTSNIGIALAKLEQRVLLLDADVGLKNLDLLLGLENRIVYNGLDVLNGECRLTQALIQDKRQPNLTFFPLSSNQLKLPVTKEQINDLVDRLKNNYDFILIDSPAGIDEGFQVAIHTAKEAIVVVTPEVTSIRDADKVIGLLEAKGITDISLIINRLRPEMVKAENMMSVTDVKDILGIPLIGVVPDSEQVITASNRGEPLVLDDKVSIPGLAFINTARRIMGEAVEFIDFDSVTSTNPLKRLIKNLVKRSGKSY